MVDRSRRRSLLTVLLTLILLAHFQPTSAQQETPASPEAPPAAAPKFNIRPVGDFPEGFFSITAEPGATVELTALVGTTADSAPVALRTYRTNAIHPANGGFAAGAEDDEMTGPSTWVDYPAQSFELGPGEQREIAFTVTVPEDTAPGQYVAALVAQTDGPIPIPGMDTFNQVIRSALGITIVVPGPATYGFEIGTPEFSTEGAPQLMIPVTNTGNYVVRPSGDLLITTPDGATVATVPVAMGSIYGGYTATLQVALPEQMEPGDYVISGTLVDQDSGSEATIGEVTANLADRDAPPPQFGIEAATVSVVGEPAQYADVAMTITNEGNPIPTANVVLKVSRDGEPLEDYLLARNQALPQGPTTIAQRYIPAGGWTTGTYTFEIVVSSTSLQSGSEVILATTSLDQTIVIP